MQLAAHCQAIAAFPSPRPNNYQMLQTPKSTLIPSLLRRLTWYAARRLGKAASIWVWNDQYRRGHWDYITRSKSAFTLSLVARHANGGRILELGCGEGLLPRHLPAGCYSSYLGIDISAVAIEKARAHAGERSSFMVRCIEDWPGDQDVAVILIEEALYYLTLADQESVLHRCMESLSPGGAVIVVIHDAVKHRKSLELVRRVGAKVDETTESGRVFAVLAAPKRRDGVAPLMDRTTQ